jgi:hypothetical protein
MKQLTLTACLVIGIAMVGFAGAPATKAYSLTIKLAGNHDHVVTVCTLIRTAEPFEVALTDAKTQTLLSGKLEHAKSRGMRLELEVWQGRGERGEFDRLGYELTLGGAMARPVVVYTRNHPGVEEPEITVADGGCPTLKDDELK